MSFSPEFTGIVEFRRTVILLSVGPECRRRKNIEYRITNLNDRELHR